MLRYLIPLVILFLLIIWILFFHLLPIMIVLSIFMLIWSIRIVTPNTVKTVETLWKFNRILRPWLNFIMPFVEWTRNQDLLRKNFIANVESISSDNVSVAVRLNVIYYVLDDRDDSVNWNIYKSIYSIQNFVQILESTIDEQLRALISTFDHKEIFWKRQEIWDIIEYNLRQKLSEFGYTLDSIQVRDIVLDSNVMVAMNKVIETEKLRQRAINEWEALKIKAIKAAEADKETKILIWQWMAGQRMEIAKWFKESVDMIRSSDENLSWDKILKFLLDSSRIETLNNIWNSDKTKLIYLNEDLEWRWMTMNKETKLIAWSELMK